MSYELKFKEWLENLSDHKYLPQTVYRYVRALKMADTWFSNVSFSVPIFEIEKETELKNQLDVIRADPEYDKINQNHGHGDFSAAIALYLKFLQSVQDKAPDNTPQDEGLKMEEGVMNISADQWRKFIEEVELPNHKGCMGMLKALMEQGGEASCKKLADIYGGTPNSYNGSAMNIGRRAKKYFDLTPVKYKSSYGSSESLTSIPFEGRDFFENGQKYYGFKIRKELLEALKEIDLSNINPYIQAEEDDEGNPVAVEKQNSYTQEDFLNQVYMSKEQYKELKYVLEYKKNVILQGPPGVGKTYAAKRLAYSIMGEMDDDRIEFVQFHQNYSYEDFVMGYKPAGDGFVLKNGIFFEFCQKAANQPDKEFFFIIDEINRGNMSKIFGELLMLIEKDYRGEKATLAYTGAKFTLPPKLHIIGMMNTADRSLAMIDYALRRRFSFVEMKPGFDSEGFVKYQSGLNSEKLNKLIDCVKELNEIIKKDNSLGEGFCIGHSYFCGQEVCTDEWLNTIVEYDLIPTLSEYWFDEPEKLDTWKNNLRGALQ